MRPLRFALLLAGLALLLAPGLLTAQKWHKCNPTPPLFLPAERGVDMPYIQDGGQLVLGDFDRDRDLDVLFLCFFAQPRLFFNDGKGHMTEVTEGHVPKGIITARDQGVQAGDVDGDGDLDVLISNGDIPGEADGNLTLWLNNGKGKFTDVSRKRLPEIVCAPALFADVDRDKDLDIVFGRSGKQNGLLLNNGSGYFIDVTATHMPVDTDHPFSLAVGDVDKDGDLDIVAGNWRIPRPREQVDTLYLNDGTGKFAFAPAGSMPTLASATRGVELFDWEGDGDLDIVVAAGMHFAPAGDLLYLNNGSGKFTEATPAILSSVVRGSRRFRVGDVDGDGDKDLLLPGTNQTRLLRNDRLGIFTDVTATDFVVDPHNRNRTAVFGDMDGDKDVDVVLSVGQHVQLYRNNGKGQFSTYFDSWLPLRPSSAENAAFGDVDGDGDVDLVFAVYPYGADVPFQNTLYLNDGRGRFTDVTAAQMPADSDASVAVVLVDVDGDKDLDLFFGNEGPSKLYLNDGSGFFKDVSATNLPKYVNHLTYGAKAGDVDGDGDPDLVLANAGWGGPGGQNQLWLNDGKGVFTDATDKLPAAPSMDSKGLALEDVDKDGDLDILVGNGFFVTQLNSLWLNDLKKSGKFLDASATNLPPIAEVTLDLNMGDVNGDGAPDFYESTGIEIANPRVDRFYLNDGKGKFTEVSEKRFPKFEAGYTFAALFGDFDGDGDQDLYVGSSRYFGECGTQNRLYLNNGKGYFKDYTAALPVGNDHVNGLAMADVDRDGDLDVLSVCYYESQLYLNLTRQTWAPKGPFWGKGYTIEAYAQRAGHKGRCWVMPMIARKPASIPTPRGLLGLHPCCTWSLGFHRTHPNTANASLRMRIPCHPAMIGTKVFYLQSVAQHGCHWKGRLTNTLEEVIIK
jgi:hypothetical protein